MDTKEETVTLHLKDSETNSESATVRTSNLPFIDNVEETIEVKTAHTSHWPPLETSFDGKPKIRYFAIGPGTEQVKCPLCNLRIDTETVHLTQLFTNLSCLLSCLSCCFPLLSIGIALCCLSNRIHAERFFCPKCGGHLGFYSEPV